MVKLDTVIAQLRHAYTHLKNERVTKQAEFADGLIAPQITALEKLQRDEAHRSQNRRDRNRLRIGSDDVYGNGCGNDLSGKP